MAEYHGAARAVGGCAIYVRYDFSKPSYDFKRQIQRAKLGHHDCTVTSPVNTTSIF